MSSSDSDVDLLTTEAGSVGGFGPGAFILLFAWFLSIAIALFLVRSGKALIGVILCIVVALVSVVLIVLPRENRNSEKDIILYDRTFWPRLALIIGMFVCMLGGAAVSALENLEIVAAKKL